MVIQVMLSWAMLFYWLSALHCFINTVFNIVYPLYRHNICTATRMYVTEQQENNEDGNQHGTMRREECERLIDVTYNTDESTRILVEKMQEVGVVLQRSVGYS